MVDDGNVTAAADNGNVMVHNFDMRVNNSQLCEWPQAKTAQRKAEGTTPMYTFICACQHMYNQRHLGELSSETLKCISNRCSTYTILIGQSNVICFIPDFNKHFCICCIEVDNIKSAKY